MDIQNAKRWSRFSALQSVSGTVLLTSLAFLIRYSLSPLIQPFAVFHFFILSCLTVQFLFGYRYALSSMIASALLGEYFFVDPVGTFNELLTKDIIIVLNFIGVTMFAIALIEFLQRGIYARELLLKVSNSRYLASLQLENDRLYYSQKSSDAWSVLSLLLKNFERVILVQHGEDTVRLEPLFYELTGQPASGLLHPLQWIERVCPHDRSLLMQHLGSSAPSKTLPAEFSLRLSHVSDASRHDTTAKVTRFTVMNRPLLILTLHET